MVFGRQHGPDDPRCRYIPWICFGPRQSGKNLDLTTLDLSTTGEQTINTEDTFLHRLLSAGNSD